MPLPPGPSQPAAVQLWHWIRNPLDYLDECRARFGDTFTLNLPGVGRWVITDDPEVIRELFRAGPAEVHAGEANVVLKPFLGEHSLLLLDGERHLRVRRLMLPPFHGERMQAYGRAMLEIADAAVDRFPLGETFAIHRHMQGITMDVIIRTVFGVEAAARHDELSSTLTELLEIGAWAPLMLPAVQVDLGPWSPWGRFLRLAARADRLLLDEIRRSREEEAKGDGGAASGDRGRTDILSLLVSARDEDGRPMSDEELRDELVTLLVAGHETTATSLAWALRWLLTDAPLLDRLTREIRASMRGGELEPERVNKLELLDATVRETLRLVPVVPLVGRVLKRAMKLGPLELPAETKLLPCIYLTQRRPEVFPRPATFDPDRFLRGAKPSPSEWFPFGGGIRRCIGMAFAIYEMKMVLAAILSRASLRIAAEGPIRPVRRSITLSPSGGMPVVLDSRRPRGAE